MVISHKFKYLFLEVPLTASWSIRNELCKYYHGEPILHKHAMYPEFRKIASNMELNYFVFGVIRNPLDKLVSRYCKLQSDHKGAFSNPESIQTLTIDYSDRVKYEYINETGASFQDFFRKFCTRPFTDMVDISSSEINFVIRYEQLQNDFSKVLYMLGIKQVRPVPLINKTKAKTRSWESYYQPEIIEQAKLVCGPFMIKWGYDFPADWGVYKGTKLRNLEFRLMCLLKTLYITHFRYKNTFFARILRKIRSIFI